MLGKISILPTMLAMLMVMFATIVPHHHHDAMICLVMEICEADGGCDHGHAHHADPNQEEEETRCVAHEKYCPSDNLRLDFMPLVAVTTTDLPKIFIDSTPIEGEAASIIRNLHKPPILTWRINC